MLKLLSLSAAAAIAFATTAQAQVTAPQPVRPQAGQSQLERDADRPRADAQDRTVQPGTVLPDAQRTRGEPAAVEGGRGDLSARLNGQLADCLILHNQEEINLARFALEHTQNPKVKDFAQRLIDDHQKLNESLMRFAHHSNRASQPESAVNNRAGQTFTQPEVAGGRQPIILPTTPLTEPSDRLNANRPIDATIRGERIEVRAGYAGSMNSLDETWYQIERQAAQNCEEMTKEMLSQEKGEKFDHCFVGSQIGSHIGMLAKLKAAESRVSGDFQQVLRDGIQTVSQHKQHAEALQKDLRNSQSTVNTEAK